MLLLEKVAGISFAERRNHQTLLCNGQLSLLELPRTMWLSLLVSSFMVSLLLLLTLHCCKKERVMNQDQNLWSSTDIDVCASCYPQELALVQEKVLQHREALLGGEGMSAPFRRYDLAFCLILKGENYWTVKIFWHILSFRKGCSALQGAAGGLGMFNKPLWEGCLTQGLVGFLLSDLSFLTMDASVTTIRTLLLFQ